MSTPIRVLMVEDRESDAELVRHELGRAGFDPAWERVETEAEYLAALETNPDLILADWSLPQFDGWKAMKILRERELDIPFIIVSGSIGEDVAVEAMREGATDYLLKDRLGRLGEAARRAMGEKLLREENKRSEIALRDSEAKYRSLVEQSSDGVVVVDEQGMIINWNSRQEEMTGKKQVEVLGRPLWDVQFQMMPDEIKNPAIEEMLEKAIRSLLKSGHSPRQGQELETIVQLSDGTRRTLLMTTYQFKTVKGFMGGSISRDITERKRAEEVLRETSDYLEKLFRYANSPIIVWDSALRITRFNTAFERLSGYTMAEVVGKNLSLLFPQTNHIESLEKIERALHGEYWKTVEIPIQCKDGAVRWILWNSANIYAKDKVTLQATIAQGMDITERKRAEENLYESEKEFHSLAEAMPQIVWITRPDGWNIYFNQQWVEYTGLTLEESYGHGWNKPFHPDDQQRAWDAWQNATGNLAQYSLECRLRRADGVYKWWLIRGVPIMDEDGSILKWFGTCTDINEMKLAEESIRESEDKFKYVFDHSVAGKSFTMPTGDLNANQAFADMLGYPLDELNHHKWEGFTHPQDVELTKEANRSMLSGEKESVRFTKRFIHRDGSIVWVDVASTLRRGKDGKPLYFMSTFLDITDRKKAEEEIRKLNADLEQRVEERTLELRQAQEKLVRQEKLAMLGQLAGGVGHELRNPLGIISSAIYYLQLVQPKAGGKIKHYHDLIEAEVHNAEKIITELMDFARLESMERGLVSVSDLVERTLARFTVPEYIKTKLILPGDLPNVLVDSRQMEQVLGNITMNACQAMGSQNSKTIIGKHMLLTISARLKKGMVAIAVKDTGSGITPENMSKIFEPLFTTKAKGIGLGLAVSRKLAEANGGRIEVKSELGKGSTFTLILPVAMESPDPTKERHVKGEK